MRWTLSALAMTTLGACAQLEQAEQSIASLDLLEDTERLFAAEFLTQPFQDGVVYAVAEEHGEIHTYVLTPCRGNTHICGPNGRQGHMSVAEDYAIVTGAYAGRSFYLRPGGDGYLLWRGTWHPMAWD